MEKLNRNDIRKLKYVEDSIKTALLKIRSTSDVKERKWYVGLINDLIAHRHVVLNNALIR